MIKFKDFEKWTKEHANLGKWNFHTGIFCMCICRTINSLPFWKKRKIWLSINKICNIKALMQMVDVSLGIRKFVMK